MSKSLAESGAKIGLVSSVDPRYPPENMLDGDTHTFWITTGSFPQEAIISLNEPTPLQQLFVQCSGVSKINLEVSSSTNPDSFSVLHEVDLPRPKEGKLQLQIAEFTSSVVMPIKHMKLVLEKPLSNVDFASIHQIVMR